MSLLGDVRRAAAPAPAAARAARYPPPITDMEFRTHTEMYYCTALQSTVGLIPHPIVRKLTLIHSLSLTTQHSL